ncbi:MAG: acyl carrier protein [Firmicutes bacterium HGW-Firmicutes-14]|nr:MAG: acyl carrier protein [Firmicutes bacterium HGW-Firmicutes-14]
MAKYTKDDIFQGLRSCLAQVLEIEENEINLKDSLVNDLGVDSLDFLDLVFRIETTFKIKLKRGEIEGLARDITGAEGFEINGVITPQGISALQQALPEVPQDRFKDNLRVAEIPTLFTVETFVKLVETKLEGDNHAS